MAVSAVLVGCADAGLTAGSSDPSPTAPSPAPDDRRLGVYEAVIRAMADREPWFGAVYIERTICDEERDPDLERACPDAFTADEESALLADLSDLDEVAFVDRADDVVLPSSAVRHDGVVIRVGPILGEGDRVEVEASVYCGNVCGHFLTLVVERSDEDWRATGTVGPVGVA